MSTTHYEGIGDKQDQDYSNTKGQEPEEPDGSHGVFGKLFLEYTLIKFA